MGAFVPQLVTYVPVKARGMCAALPESSSAGSCELLQVLQTQPDTFVELSYDTKRKIKEISATHLLQQCHSCCSNDYSRL